LDDVICRAHFLLQFEFLIVLVEITSRLYGMYFQVNDDSTKITTTKIDKDQDEKPTFMILDEDEENAMIECKDYIMKGLEDATQPTRFHSASRNQPSKKLIITCGALIFLFHYVVLNI
jgi:hypothetical protein